MGRAVRKRTTQKSGGASAPPPPPPESGSKKKSKVVSFKGVVSGQTERHLKYRRRSDLRTYADVTQFHPAGTFALDWAFGRPGLPYGGVVEVFAGENSAKSAVAATMVRAFASRGHQAVIFDAENAYTDDWLDHLGIPDVETLYICQHEEEAPMLFEHVCDSIIDFAKASRETGDPTLLVWDTPAETLTMDEDEKSIAGGEPRVADRARILTKLFRKLRPLLASSRVCLVVVSQLKTRGPQTSAGGGIVHSTCKPTVGGKSLDFNASLQLYLKRTIKQSGSSTAKGGYMEVEFTTIKNKICPDAEKRSGRFRFLYRTGVDSGLTISDVGVESGVLTARAQFVALTADVAKVKWADAKKSLNSAPSPEMREAVMAHTFGEEYVADASKHLGL